MASKIEDTKIFLTRGDTFKSTVSMCYKNEGTGELTPYTPQAGDVVRFAMKGDKMTPGNQDYVDKTPLILKVIPNDTLLLKIDPSDTKNLKFGNYKYDIEITFANGDVCTFIEDADFILTREVH